MKKIKLSIRRGGKHNGYVALVDDEDYEYLNQWRWSVSLSHNTFYATRYLSKANSGGTKKIRVFMHRQILKLKDSKIFCDHIDGNGLNNQRCNLRPCTPGQNQYNRAANLNSSSKYRGVSFYRQYKNKKWKASIKKNGITYTIGHYQTENAAALAYNEMAIQLFGEFAKLNVITPPGLLCSLIALDAEQ